MSVFRVITRIIPLNSPESTFEPASFDQLTDGNVGEVKVLNLTEPQSGMKYRIERIEYVQNAGPGESIESINNAYAEKLNNIPGFVKLKAGDMPLNPYDKSFQLTLPKVLFSKSSDESSNSQQKSSDSFKISVVRNFNFKKASPKLKKSTVITLDKSEKEDIQELRFKTSKSLNDSKVLFKSKYPPYLSKKLKKSVWKNKIKSPKSLKSQKLSKSDTPVKSFLGDCSTSNISQKRNCPTSNYLQANKNIDARKTLDLGIPHQDFKEKKYIENNDSFDNSTKRNGNIIHDDQNNSTDDSLDSDCGELIINVPESVDMCSSLTKNESLRSHESLTRNKTLTLTKQSSIASDDSLLGDSSILSNPTDYSHVSENILKDTVICKKFSVREDNPLHDLLMALKKYFVNGECLICGFIPTDKDFNASDHMESHVLSNSFTSSYKCSCCDEKFANPRNLYMHALSREKSYKYICSICTLKFKRRHYLSRHTAKSH